jgi:hypothetical protein
MGRLSRALGFVDGLEGLNSKAAFRRFSEPGIGQDDRMLHPGLTAALIVVAGILAFIGWLFTL